MLVILVPGALAPSSGLHRHTNTHMCMHKHMHAHKNTCAYPYPYTHTHTYTHQSTVVVDTGCKKQSTRELPGRRKYLLPSCPLPWGFQGTGTVVAFGTSFSQQFLQGLGPLADAPGPRFLGPQFYTEHTGARPQPRPEVSLSTSTGLCEAEYHHTQSGGAPSSSLPRWLRVVEYHHTQSKGAPSRAPASLDGFVLSASWSHSQAE